MKIQRLTDRPQNVAHREKARGSPGHRPSRPHAAALQQAPPTSTSSVAAQNLVWTRQLELEERRQSGRRTSTPGMPAEAPVRREQQWLPSLGWRPGPNYLSPEQLWERIRAEAHHDLAGEPALASMLHSTILSHSSLAKSMAFLLANKLSSRTLLGTQLMSLILDCYEDSPDLLEAGLADMQAVYERDAACSQYTQCMLYFKGFQAVQSHRLAHWLWQGGRQTLALALQSRMSEVMHVDIHPAARLGRGVMLDHATGCVIGETAAVGDNVSLLHHVTLGGSGTGTGNRHPRIGHGVLLGAGVSVLGPVTVGPGTKVGAGSVVVTDLPPHCVAVGVPARVIKRNCTLEPSVSMDHVEDFVLDFVI